MFVIDPHVHMVSRTTTDYENMAMAGVVAVSEPAFWAGFDRTPAAFADYYRQLTEFEPQRAAQFGVAHYCWMCLNPKEAEDLGKAREVMSLLPGYLKRPTVLGVGEIGLHKNTANEMEVFRRHVQLAIDAGGEQHRLILIHTPHLEDKWRGTRLIIDILREFGSAIDPARVLIDHCEEHTIRMVKDAGFWAGMTVYPTTKATPERAVDMIEIYGSEQICINAAADWGISDPLWVHRTMLEARRRGHNRSALTRIFHNNPAQFFGQHPGFTIRPVDITDRPATLH